MSNFKKAEKNDEELTKMEQELAAQEPEEVEEPQVDQEVEEQTTPEESASSEVEPHDEEPETAEDKESEADSVEAGKSAKEDFTEEEWEALGDKSKRQFTKLREKARLAEELMREKERAAQLKEVAEEAKKESYKEPKSKLPWDDSETQKAGKWASTLMEDIKYAEREYPELNPDHEDYNDELTGGLLQDFRELRKANSNTRLKDLVDRRMKTIVSARKEALERAKKREKLQKQKATSAPPSGVTPKTKKVSASDKVKQAKSMDELEKLEKEIGVSDRFK